MKVLILLTSLFLSSFAYSMEVRDIVMDMKKNQGEYEVSFGSVARIYSISTSDKSIQCLQRSLTKKEKVSVKLDLSSGRIMSCGV